MDRPFLRACSVLALIALVPGVSAAQRGFRTEGVADLGIEFSVYEKLSAIPTKLGVESRSKARFEPQDASDFIHGRYGPERWGMEVTLFPRAPAAVTGEGKEKEKEKEGAAAIPEEIRLLLASQNAKSFADYLENDPSASGRKFLTKAKSVKARGKVPEHELWEWIDTRGASYGGQAIQLETLSLAAVYDIDGNDVVLVCELPVKKDDKADAKFYSYAKKMVESLAIVEKVDATIMDPEKDKFADTPEKQQALAAAKANIASLNNWDYITSANYIILYSWNAEKPAEKRDAWMFARTVSEKMEIIRERFQEAYPPAPEQTFPYSVIRVCGDYNEFSAYGNTPRGVVGWFSPGTKEVVIFFDKGRIFGAPEDAIEISYHESWHQYSDSYFGDGELHRWFDEGLAEYFSQFRKRGRNWQRVVLDGRFRDIRDMINTSTFVPLADIVYWPRSTFYGPGAPHYYAQAYSMVDFMLEGKRKLGSAWKPQWDGILERYGKVFLESQDSKKASDAAFEGVDMAELTAAWIDWVKKYMDK